MSILKVAYQLTKEILDCSERNSVKSTLQEIEDFEKPKIGDKVDIGRLIRNDSARSAKMQFYGYLLANHYRKKIEKEINRFVPELKKEHREALEKVHREILFINLKCMEHLPNDLVHSDILNPYGLNEEIINLPKNYTSSIFEQKHVKSMSDAFAKHKGYKLIRKISKYDRISLNKINSQDLFRTVESFKEIFYKSGVEHYPRDIEQVINLAKKNDSIVPVKYILSLLCIKLSMRNINQLIYQAFNQDKLSLFSVDNIIDIKSSSHFAGKGYIVKAQEVIGNARIGTLDLVHLINPNEKHNHPILCQVEGITVSLSNDYGETNVVKLRALDHDLNPFSGILNNLERY